MYVADLTRRFATGLGIAACFVVLAAACSSATDDAEPTLTTITDLTEPSQTTVPQDAEPDVEPAPESATLANTPLSGSLTATVIDTHPHDSDAFTQGLEIFDGRFIEGTGLFGESDRRVVDIATGETITEVAIDLDFFGEGITVVGDEVLQLTWQAGVVIRSDTATLAEISRDTYEGEGWGLCFNGESLAMSNGSSTLTFRDPETFDPTRTVAVTLDGVPVENLNELECVNGQVIANVWLSDLIVVIDPSTGEVVATLDGGPLRPEGLPVEDSSFALNGIAHDPSTGRFYLTGKLWPVVYEVALS